MEIKTTLPHITQLQAFIAENLKTNSKQILQAVQKVDVGTAIRCVASNICPPVTLLKTAIPTLQASIQGDFAATEDSTIVYANHIQKNGKIHHPFSPIFTNGIQFSTFDSNPLAMDEAHPEKSGNAVSTGGKEISEWVNSLQVAGQIISLTLPQWWQELPLSLQRIVPVGFDEKMHLSASYQEAIGLAYLSLHPDPLIMAEAIIHETQHNKLNVLFWLDDVLYNGNTEWTKSPVRPDMRPLKGVLLAAHAFVPVAAMHAQLHAQNHPISQRIHFRDRRQQVLESNAQALETLRRKAQPTKMGAKLLEGLFTLHKATCTL